MQEGRNSIANALELRLSCTNPWIQYIKRHDKMGFKGAGEGNSKSDLLNVILNQSFDADKVCE